jgi:hypothetical protein
MIRRRSDDVVYLMSKTRMSGEHAELFSYDLYLDFLSDKRRREELDPVGNPGYSTVHSDWEEPRAYLLWSHGGESTELRVTNHAGKFQLKFSIRATDVLERPKDKLAPCGLDPVSWTPRLRGLGHVPRRQDNKLNGEA